MFSTLKLWFHRTGRRHSAWHRHVAYHTSLLRSLQAAYHRHAHLPCEVRIFSVSFCPRPQRGSRKMLILGVHMVSP